MDKKLYSSAGGQGENTGMKSDPEPDTQPI